MTLREKYNKYKNKYNKQSIEPIRIENKNKK